MEPEADPCSICGGNETKLIDGFYYCVECGTQNANVRETIIEDKSVGEGIFGVANRKKIIKIKKDGIEMSGEWYKWHSYNFILLGLADELISLGASPTFKVKLQWIWTRYIKKYQNKSEMMNKTSQNDNDNTVLPSFMAENIEDEAEDDEEYTRKSNIYYKVIDGSDRDVKYLSRGVITAMLYLALNFDESDIQLSHLLRFIHDKQLDMQNLKKYVPLDINLKKIPNWLNFAHSKLRSSFYVRALAMSLIKKLNLGRPKVPNLRKIVDNFLTELCLPNDMKSFIYSLLHFRKCNYIDLDNQAKKCLIRIPDYEGTVMTCILVAIKICFGLDGDYEIKLSDVVERINAERQLPKSYKIGKYSEPSGRLFSFREWCNYLQFRKVMLCKHNLRIAQDNCVDVDDCVYLEQMEERPKHNEELPDKISMEIISRIPHEQENEGVISKELFVPTLTPKCDYTDVIIEHYQDPEIKLMLAEDFKRYSLKYACENLELFDANTENVITGVRTDKKKINGLILGTLVTKSSKRKTKMIYVKNCENRNWMNTKPPTMEHVVSVESETEVNDKESDHGYDSEITLKEKDIDSVGNKNPTDEIEMVRNESVNDLTIKSVSEEIGMNTDQSVQNDLIFKSASDVIEMVTDESVRNDLTIKSAIDEVEATTTEGAENDLTIKGAADEVEMNTDESVKNSRTNKRHEREIIEEEDEDKNIFDDCFEDIDFKEECERDIAELSYNENDNEVNNFVEQNNFPEEDFDERSDVSDEFVPVFNPNTFDRLSTIRELVMFKCKKYKIAPPTEYKVKERRKRKERLLGDDTPAKRTKRAYGEGKATVEELLNNYYNHVQSDFVTKVQQEMSLAIRNAELEHLNSNQNNMSGTNLQVSVIERNSTVENGLNTPIIHSERNSTCGPIDEQNIDLNVTSQTNTNDKTLEIFEDLEKTLFEDDEEMQLDDLVPKGDPKFDEENYHTDQLYIKIKEKQIDDINFDLNGDPELDEIIVKKIEECKSSKFQPKAKKIEESDSEDDTPLNVIKEEIEIIEEMSKQEDNYERLVSKENIPEFNYWIRHYDKEFMRRSHEYHLKFNEELKENTPASFFFVIQECSSVLNSTNFYLYKSMQSLEECLIDKAKNPDCKIQINDSTLDDIE